MKWKRFLSVGCSHGNHIDPRARDAVVRFCREWKPDKVIHLGDFIDTAAFRSGNKGSADEAAELDPDFSAGLDFLEAIGCTTVMCGNHEDRLWRDAHHYNAKVKALARFCIGQISARMEKIGAELIPYEYKAAYHLGNYSFFHGWFYNEMAARDHAEAFGNCIFAHTHRTAVAKGRRVDNPTGYCVGTLSDIPAMEYAKSRRATLGWSQGFVWGEYTDSRLVCWLHEQPQGTREWRLPI